MLPGRTRFFGRLYDAGGRSASDILEDEDGDGNVDEDEDKDENRDENVDENRDVDRNRDVDMDRDRDEVEDKEHKLNLHTKKVSARLLNQLSNVYVGLATLTREDGWPLDEAEEAMIKQLRKEFLQVYNCLSAVNDRGGRTLRGTKWLQKQSAPKPINKWAEEAMR